MKIKRPMLAYSKTPDLTKLKYPKLLSPKIDGIRCLIVKGKALTRTLKPIPNEYVRGELEKYAHDGWDGELVLPGKDFNDPQSAIMSHDGEPKFEYWVFDACNKNLPYVARIKVLERYNGYFNPFKLVPQRLVNSAAEVAALEEKYLAEGYEGVMLRDLDGPYKQGRATLKEEYLLKVKRFEDAEAVVIGVVELMENTNVKKKDERGYAKRSKAKAGLKPSGKLGALVVKDYKTGVEFEIGTGFTDAQRCDLWKNELTRLKLIGRHVTYKHQPHGAKDKPRIPVFKGFRDKRDL